MVVWAPWVGGGLDERMIEAASTYEPMDTDDELAQSEPGCEALGLRLARCRAYFSEYECRVCVQCTLAVCMITSECKALNPSRDTAVQGWQVMYILLLGLLLVVAG